MSQRPLLATAAAALTLATGAAAAPPAINVTDAWCRAAPRGAPVGGCYLGLNATADDRLIAVETSAAKRAEIHTMSFEGGVMKMRPLPDGIALPAGRLVALKPSGEHLMIIGPHAPMITGGALPLTLKFANAPPIRLQLPIRATRPAPPSAASH
jgi:copper(I)-binding protein